MSVRISFGIIVLNGEPLTRYCIRSLYPHAYEIIIAEGACKAARNVATENGHSRDNTLDILYKIKAEEDPLDKIKIITAEDEGFTDGFWPGEKHQQFRAVAGKATGDYLWQVDIDEFYLSDDIQRIRKVLSENREISCVSFRQFSFWGGFDYFVDSWYLRRHLPEIYRIFKWEEGYEYISHRPPTVLNSKGENVKNILTLNSRTTSCMGIYMYHYSFVFPKQINEKVEYYRNVDWSKLEHTKWWSDEVYFGFHHPFRMFIIDEFPGWLNRFRGKHPEIIAALITDLKTPENKGLLREVNDIDALLNSWWYRIAVIFVKYYDYVDSVYYRTKRKLRRIL